MVFIQPLDILLKNMSQFSDKGGGNTRNTPHVFYVETTWKRPFPRRFNVEYKWCVCGESVGFVLISPRQTHIEKL